MSFHENDFEHIKTEKLNVSGFDLLSTKYVVFNIVKTKKSATMRTK